MTINYTIGDATQPTGTGQKLITHICNDRGGWGSGFVLALNRHSLTPRQAYRRWYMNGSDGSIPFALGEAQIVNYTDGVWVANMIAQHGIRHDPNDPPAVRYDALRSTLTKVADYAHRGISVPSVHMPRIGCGLGGGSWDEIEPIINDTLIARGIPVTVYDLEEP